ncbi:MAG: MipA/OmpV family protein, partial [Kiritimatiellales bacterium]
WSTVANTEEIFAAMTLNDIILTPVVTAYYDINEVNGWYWNLALSQPLEVSDVLSFEVGASLGYGSKNYNEAYFSEDNGSGAVNDYNVYVSGSYALTEQLSLGALLQYSCLDGGVGDDFEANAGETDNLVWGGVSLSYTF